MPFPERFCVRDLVLSVLRLATLKPCFLPSPPPLVFRANPPNTAHTLPCSHSWGFSDFSCRFSGLSFHFPNFLRFEVEPSFLESAAVRGFIFHSFPSFLFRVSFPLRPPSPSRMAADWTEAIPLRTLRWRLSLPMSELLFPFYLKIPHLALPLVPPLPLRLLPSGKYSFS